MISTDNKLLNFEQCLNFYRNPKNLYLDSFQLYILLIFITEFLKLTAILIDYSYPQIILLNFQRKSTEKSNPQLFFN